jgi:hypothetical protein
MPFRRRPLPATLDTSGILTPDTSRTGTAAALSATAHEKTAIPTRLRTFILVMLSGRWGPIAGAQTCRHPLSNYWAEPPTPGRTCRMSKVASPTYRTMHRSKPPCLILPGLARYAPRAGRPLSATSLHHHKQNHPGEPCRRYSPEFAPHASMVWVSEATVRRIRHAHGLKPHASDSKPWRPCRQLVRSPAPQNCRLRWDPTVFVYTLLNSAPQNNRSAE